MKKGSFEKFQTKRKRNLPLGIYAHQDSLFRQRLSVSAVFEDVELSWAGLVARSRPGFFLHSLSDSIESPLPVCMFLHGDRSPRRNWGRTNTLLFRFLRTPVVSCIHGSQGSSGESCRYLLLFERSFNSAPGSFLARHPPVCRTAACGRLPGQPCLSPSWAPSRCPAVTGAEGWGSVRRSTSGVISCGRTMVTCHLTSAGGSCITRRVRSARFAVPWMAI